MLEATFLKNYRRIGSLEARISQSRRELPMYLEAGGQIPQELSKNWKPGSQNQQDSLRITNVSSRIIDEFKAWGSEWDLQKSFKTAVGSLGTGFGHFPIGNRSPYKHFGVACQNLKNPRHRGIGRLDVRVGSTEAIILKNYR